MHKLLIGTSILLCSVGIALVVPFGASWFEQSQAVANTPQTAVTVAEQPALPADPRITQGAPRHITVKGVGIDVSVAGGVYNAKKGTWTLNDNSAFYATITSPANSDSGNTFIYGHATSNIFGNLPRLKSGAEATVTTDNGYEFTYVYTSRETVKPTDTITLVYSGAPRLTLQTCSGIWNETRELFYFDLKSFRKI